MNSGKRKILIIDDSSTNVLLLQDILEEFGYEAVIKSDSKEALKCVPKEMPDLILLDIMMPGLSGLKFLEKISQMDKIKSIPVIMVTAKNDNESKQKAKELGAVDYIVKPISVEDIIDRVDKALSKSGKA
ncbi:MAG: response regulator [Bacteroidales bacterium]|nr:response regulator [Bacteroidales bacterium]